LSNPGPSLREQGLQALREANLDRAIDLLVRAVMADDRDTDAKAALGIAYSQKGLHEQAKRAIQTAVERQPQNAAYRYNLGLVLERAGDVQGAIVAFRDTLLVQPQHPQALAKIQAMGPQGQALLAAAPKPPQPVAPSVQSPPAAPPAYAPPPQYVPQQYAPPGAAPGPVQHPGMAAPPAAPSAAPYGHPPMAPPAADPGATTVAAQGPPGTIQCGQCGEWSPPSMVCAACGAPMAPPKRTVTEAPPPVATELPSSAYSAHAMHEVSGGYGTESHMSGFEALALRALAVGIDRAILTAVWTAIALVINAKVFPVIVLLDPMTGLVWSRSPVMASLYFSLFITYDTAMHALCGQTLGKMVFGLRVVDEMGGKVGWVRCLWRATFARLAGMMCFVAYLAPLWDADQQGWHDKISGTHVVRR
jgi:uncharacterized RDD family membrane protein YckC